MFETVAYELNVPRQAHTDFNGRTTTLFFDPLGRLRHKLPDPFFAAETVSIMYYHNGQREYMTDQRGLAIYNYDEQQRLMGKSWMDWQGSLTYELVYGYHPDGSLSGITNASSGAGTSVRYEWNKLRQLERVIDHRLPAGAQTTSYGYYPVGSLQSCAYPNGTTHAYTYDEQNRLKDLTVNGSGLLARFEYTVGPAGNRTKVVEPASQLSPIGRTVQWAYTTICIGSPASRSPVARRH
jgi:YD repeat-containing protein